VAVVKLEEMLAGLHDTIQAGEGAPPFNHRQIWTLLQPYISPLTVEIAGGFYYALSMVHMYGIPDDLEDYRETTRDD